MKNIGLFGGTFDPIHNGHLHIARAFADEIGLDTVVFLPAGDPYTKTRPAPRPRPPHHDRTRHRRRPPLRRQRLRHRPRRRDLHLRHRPNLPPAIPRRPTLVAHGQRQPHETAHLEKWQTLVRQTHIAVAMRQGDNLNQTPRELHAWLGEALQNGSVRILNAPCTTPPPPKSAKPSKAADFQTASLPKSPATSASTNCTKAKNSVNSYR